MSDFCEARRVPAEWEAQKCIWLSWPHQESTWPGRYESIPSFYVGWIRILAETHPIKVLAAGSAERLCSKMLPKTNNVEVIPIQTNDCWIRDYGPTFIRDESDGSYVGLDWRYNAWGGKYPPWDDDNQVAPSICTHLDMPLQRSELCLEGGALEFDGNGRLLVTSSSILTPTRNPGWTRQQVEDEFRLLLGVKDIIWVDGGGLSGDDTDGHIDQLARFIDRENIVVAVSNDPSDSNHRGLEANYQLLTAWVKQSAPNVNVHRLPIPPIRKINGRRLPESYCNFLRLGSQRLLLPTFGAPTDAVAKSLLQEITGAEILPVDCREMIWGLGALHCASRDQPA